MLSDARRIVVKVGSSSLTSIKGGISEESLTALADALAAKRNSGTEIILVSSGAIAAGLAPLASPSGHGTWLRSRPRPAWARDCSWPVTPRRSVPMA
ncbi:glutamate 5-kinase [Arthrobacter sp. Hiyo4]|nr:glutamate 5-kinase [Arthrobacter sp. Hiyo4]